MNKECFKCRESKPLTEFYVHKQMGDGYLGKCKACTRADVRANRKKRIDYYRKYDCDRAKNKDRMAANVARVYRKNREVPGYAKSHSAVARAIRTGKLARQPCDVCGRKDSHAHHDDYSKPLDVRWLCPPHHREVHGGKTF